jgi:hypothetical protein
MKKIIQGLLACTFVCAISSVLQAQTVPSTPTAKNEVGFVIGATETPSIELQRGGSVNLNSSLALGAEYDRLLFDHRAALYGGLDFLASPFDVKASYPAAEISPQYAYLFLSPHVRVKFDVDAALQPWLLFGGGYADFSPAQPRTGNVNVSGAGSSGTLEFGGGIDSRPLLRLKDVPVVGKLPIGVRFELRDFYSGQPNYGVRTAGSRQNNVVFTGGPLLHF